VSHVEAQVIDSPAPETPAAPWLNRHTAPAVIVAVGAVAILAFAVIMRTSSAWHLLGLGRGLVPEAYYPYWGGVLVLGTALGQFVGWGAGAALLAHAWGLLTGRSITPRVVRSAMIAVYLGLVILPLSVYHVLFGQPLLGLERAGLREQLLREYPDAHLLLYDLHPAIDLSLIPLGVAAVWILWGASDRRLAGFSMQLVLALTILTTSLAVALSLGIHSVFVHLRF